MYRFMRLFLPTLVIFTAIDLLWIGVIARQFYVNALLPLARIDPDGQFAPLISAAFITYILLSLGLAFFVLSSAVAQPLSLATFFSGAFFGFVVYGVYEGANYSVIAGWPLSLVAVDTAWGTFLSGVVTVLVSVFCRRFDW